MYMSGIEGLRAGVQVQVSEGQGAAARTKVLQEALDRQVQKEQLEIQLASGSDAAASKSATPTTTQAVLA